jgi:hypothetical protein
MPGGGFQEAVRRRGGISRVRALAARQQSHVAIAFRAGTDNGAPDWEYELRFTQGPRRPVICRERVTREGEDLLHRPDQHDALDPERLTHTCLEQVSVNRPFRDLAGFLSSVTYSSPVAQLVREPARSAGRRNDPYGGDFLEQVATTPDNVRRARLRRIVEGLRTAAPQLKDLQSWRDARGVPHLRARYRHWRPRGAWQTEDEFSDGTLRLVSILWAALDGRGPLLAEEPELSLHTEAVRGVVAMITAARGSSGQVVATTHSRDLLSQEGIALDEVLLLVPGEEGTLVRSPARFEDIALLLEGQLAAGAGADAAGPPDDRQLALFEELPGTGSSPSRVSETA